jgi:hypothetical protein
MVIRRGVRRDLAWARRVGGPGGIAAAAGLAALAGAGCKPNLDQTVSIIDAPRVIAVQSDPAEAEPRDMVKYSVLYVGPAGTVAMPAFDWSYCEERKPLAELGPVNPICLLPGNGASFEPVGVGAQVEGTVPASACQNFGPDVPPAVAGMPQPRPVDPDPTGGYYQPLRVTGPDGTITLGETRLSCGAGGAPAVVGVEYGHRYHVNTNPAMDSLSIVANDVAGPPLVTADVGSNDVAVGAKLGLRAAWRACPLTDVCGDGVCGADETGMTCAADCATPTGCTGAERFVVFDIPSQGLLVQRESMALAWYATGGAFDDDRTGRDSSDLKTTTDNVWHAPAVAGPIHLWVVLGDDRGGVGWAEYLLNVR